MVGLICRACDARRNRRNRMRTLNELINEMTNTPIDTTNPITTELHPVIGKWNGHQPEAAASRNHSKHTDQPDHFQTQFGFHNHKALPSKRVEISHGTVSWQTR